MRAVILQSNYIPWKGYFHLLSLADKFVVYDSVQYTTNDWRNRNRLIGPAGPIWLTVPIKTAGRFGQRIYDATVLDAKWARKHWLTSEQCLRDRPYFSNFADAWHDQFLRCAEFVKLAEINVAWLKLLLSQMDVQTQLILDTSISISATDPTDRIVEICDHLECDRYLTGPAGLTYLNIDTFSKRRIKLEVIDYSAYPEYPQSRTDFTHAVSILDFLSNVEIGQVRSLLSEQRLTSVN